MNNQLTMEIKTHVLITFSGVHIPITSEQNTALVEVGKDDFVEVNGSKIKGSNISDVLNMEDYYRTYPEQRPDPIFISRPNANYREIYDLVEGQVMLLGREELVTKLRKVQRHILEMDRMKKPVSYRTRITATIMLKKLKSL